MSPIMNPTTAYFLLPASPVLLLVLTAMILVLLECFPAIAVRPLKFAIALLGVIASLGAIFYLWEIPPQIVVPPGPGAPLWLSAFAQSYRLDATAILFYAGIGLFTILSLVFSNAHFHDEEALPEISILTLFIASGMMLLVSADSLLMVFLALELLSLPTYVLVGIHRKDRYSCEAALKYFLFGSFASVLLVFGIALAFAQFGTLSLTQIAGLLRSSPLPENRALIFSSLSLIFVSVAFKVGIVPFHMWIPDVYQGAPSPITGFMGSTIKLAGFGLATRLLWGMFLPLAAEWGRVVEVLAILTMFVGNLAALVQDNLKRMFAYSSVAHAGYLFLAIASVSGVGGPNVSPLFYYLIVYGLMFLGLFGILALIEKQTKNTEIYQISGFGFSHPLLAACLALFALSAAGIPPTAGFVAKYFVLREAVRSGKTSLVVLAVLSSAIGAFYYLRVIVYLYMKENKEHLQFPARHHRLAFTCIVLCALSMLYFAAMPGSLGLGTFVR
jgi:NADH-quinone oxidoreductase subunit N